MSEKTVAQKNNYFVQIRHRGSQSASTPMPLIPTRIPIEEEGGCDSSFWTTPDVPLKRIREDQESWLHPEVSQGNDVQHSNPNDPDDIMDATEQKT